MNWFGRRKKSARLTVLHVDDSKWVRIPVSILLRREFGVRVLEAENGIEGIAIAQNEIPDIILLDVMMPQLDGFDTLKQLKEHRLTKDIRVLMCTARDNTREVNIALQLGALGYLTKPIEEDHLIAQIGKILIQINEEQKPGGSVIGFENRMAQPAGENLLPTNRPEVYASPRQAPPNMAPPRVCPRCRKSLAHIEEYRAWYCYTCQYYPDFEQR